MSHAFASSSHFFLENREKSKENRFSLFFDKGNVFVLFTKIRIVYRLTLIESRLFLTRGKQELHLLISSTDSFLINLLEEIPHQSEANHEVAVRIIWRVVVVSIGGKHGVEMLGF